MMSGFDEGKEQYDAGNYSDAIAKFNESIQNNENVSSAYEYTALCYVNQGKKKEACNNFRKSLEADPNNSSASYNLGNFYLKTSKFKFALKKFNELLKKDPENLDYIIGAAKSCLGMRLYDLARTHITKAINKDDENRGGNAPNIDIHIISLKIYNETEKYQEAQDEMSNFELENFYLDNKDFIEQQIYSSIGVEDVSDALDKVNDNKDENPVLGYYGSWIYDLQDDSEDALQSIDEAINGVASSLYQEEYYKLHYQKGLILEKMKDKGFDEILHCYKTCISLCDEYTNAYIRIASIYRSFAEDSTAMKILNDGMKVLAPIQRRNEIYLRLNISEELARNKKRADSLKELNEIKKDIVDINFRMKFPNSQILEFYKKCFEISHLTRFYQDEDLKVDREQRLGGGGFSTVYAGQLKLIGLDKYEEVAVKEIKFKEDIDMNHIYAKTLFEQIFFEIYYLEALNQCDKLLKIKTVFYYKDAKQLVLVTPICKGGSLSALLKDKEIQISMKSRIKIVKQVAEALKFIHNFEEGLYHRDIKSSNVLLLEKFDDTKENIIRVIDFGSIESKNYKNEGLTPAFAAPELLRREEVYTKFIDTYSFGMLLWEVFTREIPYKNVPMETIIDDVPDGLRPNANLIEEGTPEEIKQLIDDCLKDKPNERPTDDELVSRLNNILNSLN